MPWGFLKRYSLLIVHQIRFLFICYSGVWEMKIPPRSAWTRDEGFWEMATIKDIKVNNQKDRNNHNSNHLLNALNMQAQY